MFLFYQFRVSDKNNLISKKFVGMTALGSIHWAMVNENGRKKRKFRTDPIAILEPRNPSILFEFFVVRNWRWSLKL